MELNEQNFEQEVLKSSEPVLVDFYATWCGPCQMLGPILDELEKEVSTQGMKVGKIDVDKNPALASKYGIMSIPTLILFKGGEPKETLQGVQNKDVLKEKLEALK